MKKLLFCYISICCFVSCIGHVHAHEGHTEYQTKKQKLAVSVVMDSQRQLWRASVESGFVVVASSNDLGKTFSKSIKVNQKAMKITARGEARPKIAAAANGHIYLTWTERLKERFAGYIWFARSIDGGQTFEKPYIVHQDRAKITHRFDALNVSAKGQITVLWVDKRDLLQAKKQASPYQGAAIYYAVSSNGGKSFAKEQKLVDSSCECCRIATTNKPDGTVMAMWRHVFDGGERDHMMSEIPSQGSDASLHRATFGRWKVNGCPHHGAAIARGGEGEQWWGYHMAYFDGKDKRPGLYYTRMDGVAWASFPSKHFGDYAKQAGHPALWSVQDGAGEKVWLAWRETDNKNHHILLKFSDDGGRSWRDTTVIASVPGKADYPILVGSGSETFLVWNTLKQGLVVKQL